ncbi:MAG: peptidoglycan editing factor PgeF [Gammaproteobacteria bacterium]|nr:peptidoglycan editing factor PgeF [Gammaproteobacteria bacterium]
MADSERIEVMPARWPAPPGVRAVTTLRGGGVSEGGFASLNLGGHVGDRPEHVAENRRRVRDGLGLPVEPAWLNQVHGTRCVDLGMEGIGGEADGSYTSSPERVCAVLTADCLPLFLCDGAGGQVGLFHVGWRGLAAGIVEHALSAFASRSAVLGWLGPSIGPGAFEVGPEVRDALAASGNDHCFTPSVNAGRWMADLYGLVAHRLRRGGLEHVSWDPAACTRSDSTRFFSHRRSQPCGRMASLIWIDRSAG